MDKYKVDAIIRRYERLDTRARGTLMSLLSEIEFVSCHHAREAYLEDLRRLLKVRPDFIEEYSIPIKECCGPLIFGNNTYDN